MHVTEVYFFVLLNFSGQNNVWNENIILLAYLMIGIELIRNGQATLIYSCFFRRLKSVRRILGAEVTSGLVSAFVTTRLDYSNSVLAGLPQSMIDSLQHVQNAAARLVAGTGTWDHITPVLQSLHWLPIKFRIIYKLCLLMHLVRVGRSPAYLSDMMWWHPSLTCLVLQQLPIWTSLVETKVQRTEFLVLRTEGMEFSSVQSPGFHKHWYFRKTFENSLF